MYALTQRWGFFQPLLSEVLMLLMENYQAFSLQFTLLETQMHVIWGNSGFSLIGEEKGVGVLSELFIL